MNIDITPDGTVYGIEILNADEQLAEDQGKLVVERAGQHREIPAVRVIKVKLTH